jgi:uncharacterized protein (TIGR03435 family)
MRALLIGLWFLAPALAQTSKFEAASIRVNPPQAGFHFAADSATGGPGTADPAMFRCSKCSLATLIVKAFDLHGYQFPGKSSLPDATFDIAAKIPAGTTNEDFHAMLQDLLIDRFGLKYHFKDKTVRGYQLTIAKNGPLLKQSSAGAAAPHAAGAYEGHEHSGAMAFGGTARYRGNSKTTAELARVLENQLGAPVEDRTGLKGQYDISLSWADNSDNSHTHSAGALGDAHGDHAGSAAVPQDQPPLLEAVQSQLGLKLAAADQIAAKILVVDHIDANPTAN